MRFFIKTAKNQEGSIIVIAMLLLVVMTLIGISASDTAVNESYIVRNVGLHKQNLSLAEAAALEIAEDALINIADDQAPPLLSQNSPPSFRRPYIMPLAQWTSSGKRDAWYSFGTASGRVLDGDGASFPQWIVPDFLDDVTLIDDVRGEALDSLRVSLAGWEAAAGYSLKVTGPTRRQGKILSEYVSPTYGMTRLELGIAREF